jgi:aminopeptidase N
MRSDRFIILVFLLMVAFTCPATDSIAHTFPEPSPAKCRLPVEWLSDKDFPPPPAGDRGYDVLSYDLDIQLFPTERNITGTVAIGLSALAAGLQQVRLDLVDDLTCDGVTRRGIDAVFTHEGDSLVVTFDPPLSAAAAETLTIHWHGRPPPHGAFRTGLMFRVNENGTPGDPSDDMPTVANQSEPWSSHAWWPCKDHPSDKALVSMTVTVPEPLVAVSNGILLQEDVPGPGLRRFAWREAYPIATYLVSVAATNFASWSQDCHPTGGDPVRLDFHVFPHDLEDAEIDLAPTCDMMELMVRLAGPYPFPGEKYAQVEFKWLGSMEHQTATSLSQIIFTGDRYYELVVIHELAHQWFGDSLTPALWSDIWLNEGFARYCEALWIEQAYGVTAYQEYMREIGINRHPDLFADQGILLDPDPILPNTLIYDKGAWVLHMLRMLIGDEAFFSFLADYAMDPNLVLGSVTLADMIGHAEAAAGRDLSSFFEPWVATSAVPLVSQNLSIWNAGQRNETVRLNFTQHQSPLFEMAVPVVIHTACGTREELVILSKAAEVFTWKVDCPVDSVSLDPEGMVLMRSPWAPPPVLQAVGPWPNPVPATGAEFRLFLTSDREITAKLYDIRGRIVESTGMGLLAATGPQSDPEAEPHVWTWPPTEGAASLSSGVYWVEFTGSGARAVRKITFIH